MFGDYEFLCAVYGISGASGRHCCLWCEIPKDMLKVKPAEMEEIYSSRTLESLEQNLLEFKTKYDSNLKHAKKCNNVISARFFNVPLSQVCVPGLHITLGVVPKFIKMLEQFCSMLDLKIAAKKILINDVEANETFQHHRDVLRIKEV